MAINRKIKLVIDLAMTVMLVLLMAYSMIGEAAHEWLGIALFLFFLSHQILNRRWYKSICKGRYTPARLLGLIVNVLLLFDMTAMMVSGILLSRHALPLLSIHGGASVARTVHLLGSYWGFVLMSFHLGLHGNHIIGVLQKKRNMSRRTKALLQIALGAVSLYGIYAFIIREIGTYMLLKNQFVFFDLSEPIIWFLTDYLAVMLLFAVVGFYAQKLVFSVNKKQGEKS